MKSVTQRIKEIKQPTGGYINPREFKIIELEDQIELNNEEKDKLLNNLDELSFKIENYKVVKEKNIRKNIDK